MLRSAPRVNLVGDGGVLPPMGPTGVLWDPQRGRDETPLHRAPLLMEGFSPYLPRNRGRGADAGGLHRLRGPAGRLPNPGCGVACAHAPPPAAVSFDTRAGPPAADETPAPLSPPPAVPARFRCRINAARKIRQSTNAIKLVPERSITSLKSAVKLRSINAER